MSIKFKNKIRGKPLDHVIGLSQAVVLGKIARIEKRAIDLENEEVPPYELDITHLTITKVIYQKKLDTPPIAEGCTLPVFPAALPKLIDQFKLYYEKHTKKSNIYESYTCDDDTDGERFYFIHFTCYGWSFVCRNASEGKSKRDMVTTQTKACFSDF